MQRLHGRVEHRQHHLKHRTAAALALRIQYFHQFFKRQIRMRIRAQRSLLHSPQYLPKRRIARQVGPHNQSVDKEADEPLNLGSIPPRNRRPNQNVVLPRVPLQQHLECSQQSCEQGDAFALAECLERLRQLLRKRRTKKRSMVGLHRRMPLIGRQLQRRQFTA